MLNEEGLFRLRTAVLALPDTFPDVLYLEDGKGNAQETNLELAYCTFLYRIDEKIRELANQKKKMLG